MYLVFIHTYIYIYTIYIIYITSLAASIQAPPASLTNSSSQRFLGRPTFLNGSVLNHGRHSSSFLLVGSR